MFQKVFFHLKKTYFPEQVQIEVFRVCMVRSNNFHPSCENYFQIIPRMKFLAKSFYVKLWQLKTSSKWTVKTLKKFLNFQGSSKNYRSMHCYITIFVNLEQVGSVVVALFLLLTFNVFFVSWDTCRSFLTVFLLNLLKLSEVRIWKTLEKPGIFHLRGGKLVRINTEVTKAGAFCIQWSQSFLESL